MSVCLFCQKDFSNKYSLARHIKNSKRCITSRVDTPNQSASGDTFSCGCGYTTTRKDMFLRHGEKCLGIYSNKVIEEQVKTIASQAEKLLESEKTVAKLEEQVKLLMSRPININNGTINNNQNSYNLQFYKQHAVDNFEALTQPLLQGVMDKMTISDISYGGIGFAKFAKKHLDHQHLLILDLTRRKGMYKDANGDVVVDSKLRALLGSLGLAGFSPANKIFTKWSIENREDCFLDSTKSKLLTNLVDLTGWLKRVGDGKIIEEDSGIQSNFLDELVSGYTKEALHNHLERQVPPPLIDEMSGKFPPRSCYDDNELYAQSDGQVFVEDNETEIEMDVASFASSEFDIAFGSLNYEVDYKKGVPDEKNYWIEYKRHSKYRLVDKPNVASFSSEEFDISFGIFNYEVDYKKGVPDEKNYWIEYKSHSKYRSSVVDKPNEAPCILIA
jgi:hypothetical protein